MNNLMKAEWFRLRHSGNSLLMIILFAGMSAVTLQYAGDDGFAVTAESFFLHSSLGMAIAVCVTTAIIAQTFNNRLINYEIMKGTPPMITILSKTLMSLLIVTVIYFLPNLVLLVIYDNANISIEMMLMTYICVAKLTIISMGLCIILKDIAGSTLFVIAFVFQSMPLVLMQNILNIDVVKLTPYLTSTQLLIIGNKKLLDLDELSMPLDTSHIEIKIIASFIVMTAVTFAFAYRSLKNKWEIGLTTLN